MLLTSFFFSFQVLENRITPNICFNYYKTAQKARLYDIVNGILFIVSLQLKIFIYIYLEYFLGFLV